VCICFCGSGAALLVLPHFGAWQTMRAPLCACEACRVQLCWLIFSQWHAGGVAYMLCLMQGPCTGCLLSIMLLKMLLPAVASQAS
jgi:hypothetical protein